MRRYFLLLLASLALCITGPAASMAEPEAEVADASDVTLTVLSYNIRHGRGMDDVVDLERIAEVIDETGADVVALQEVDNQTRRTDGVDQAAALAELLEMHHAFGRAIDHQGGEYGNAILARYPIERVANHPLEQVEAAEERAAIAARIRLPDGERFTLISTHLDNRHERNRLAQIDTINRILADDDEPALLVGDINAQPETKELARLGERWVQACAADSAPTFRSDDPRVRIDYIFARPADRWRAVDATVIDEPLASDHRPLRAVLQLHPHEDRQR